jgi:hypothetical protein
VSKFVQNSHAAGFAGHPFVRWPAIHADPRFLPAIVLAAGGMGAVHERHRAMKQLLNDRGRVAVAVAAYVLDPAVSIAAIVRMIPASYIGRARVAAFLRLLEREGHLLPEPEGPDRRVRQFRLGPAVKDAVTDYVEAILRPALPFSAATVPDLRDPALVRYCIIRSSLARMSGHELFEASPILRRISDLKGGNVFLLELLRGAHDPARPPQLARATLARRFDLSRTHVIDLVRLCRDEGWLTGPPGEEEPSPELIEQGRLYFARHFALASLLMENAMASGVTTEGDRGPLS